MHDRAFEVAKRAKTSFVAATAEIERKKAKVYGLLGATGPRSAIVVLGGC